MGQSALKYQRHTGIFFKENTLHLELKDVSECIDFIIWIGGAKHELQLGNCTPPVGVWTQMNTTYDGSTVTMYQDGAFIGSLSASRLIDTNTNPYTIGYIEFEVEQGRFDGAIDDDVVFDSALNQNEIQQYIGMAPAGYCFLSGCSDDGNADGDVDGNDLVVLAAKFATGGAGSGEIAAFAGQFGKNDCRLTPY